VTTPDIDAFKRAIVPNKGKGKWQSFIADLEPNSPREIPGVKHIKDNAATALRAACTKSGKQIVFRTIDGKVWACWLVEDEQS